MGAAQSQILGELTGIADLVRSRIVTEDRVVADLRAELDALHAEVMSLRRAVAHLRGTQAALPASLRPVVARAVLAEAACRTGTQATR
jgi:cell division protein FtsB